MEWKDYVRSGAIDMGLVREKPIIGVYGMFQIGKSTLINCLLGDYAALTGKGLSTTSLSTRFRHRDAFDLKYRARSGRLEPTTIEEISREDFVERVRMDAAFHIEAKLPGELLKQCDIVDTPGFNANDHDTAAAMQSLKEIHYILFVLPNRGLQQYEKQMIQELFQRRIPILFVMNCVEGRATERWIPQHVQNRAALESAEAWIASTGFRPEIINGRLVHPCNFLFYWFYQAAYEKSVNYIDRPEKIERHIRSAMEYADIPYSREAALELSGMGELIAFLSRRIEAYDFVTHAWG